MIILLILPFLFNDFVQKWYFSQGISGGETSRMKILDTDRDGNLEFIFTTYGSWPPYIYIYELHLPDIWQVDSVPLVGGDLLWDSGDFDGDGLYDLAIQFHIENPSLADGIMIYESPDSFSYPTQEVWRDTAGPPLVLPISAFDIDQDGKPEIVKDIVGPSAYLGIYEAISNNQYELIFTDNPDTSQYDAPSSTHAFGDFDGDSKIEFVMGGTGSSSTGAPFWVYECIMDNSYEKIYEDYVSTLNIKDCFSVPDADGDGKLEFVVKGFIVPTARINAFIFEATSDNTYEIIKTFDLFGGPYYGGYSDVGDVDGDSIPEIALEGCQYIYIIKAAGNDSFYVWETLSGNPSGSSVRIYDIDGNGLSEIVISGNDQTRIYEYQTGVAEDTGYRLQERRFEIYPNPFIKSLNIMFQNPTEKEVDVSIYDVSGRLVRKMYKGLASQESRIIWDGKDNVGKQLPAGIYFLRLETSNKSITKKIVKLE